MEKELFISCQIFIQVVSISGIDPAARAFTSNVFLSRCIISLFLQHNNFLEEQVKSEKKHELNENTFEK